ncbi:hypothetical protein [Mucilaginibacter sp.]|uniref:hypothetical protein n=1 Tax=Mucilaginibacter sp. TaxID=1882438 RepID=UPI0025E9980A|nr:hypothetical protein [Mucilaginibacter sp.]
MSTRFFFTTIKQTIEAFSGPHAGSAKADKKLTKQEANIRLVISLMLLVIAMYLIRYDNVPNSNYKGLPGVIIGGIIGYWLR